ncbi:MAG: hypothetical protein AABY22_30065 [Nanoarchaeota archaeon]
MIIKRKNSIQIWFSKNEYKEEQHGIHSFYRISKKYNVTHHYRKYGPIIFNSHFHSMEWCMNEKANRDDGPSTIYLGTDKVIYRRWFYKNKMMSEEEYWSK